MVIMNENIISNYKKPFAEEWNEIRRKTYNAKCKIIACITAMCVWTRLYNNGNSFAQSQ